DTGYVNYLNEAEKLDVLRWTCEALGKETQFVAGAYIEGQPGDIAALYRKQMDVIFSFGGIPILFQTSRLREKTSAEKAAVYAAVCRGFPRVLAFELGPMFAPNGEIFEEETFRRLMDIPEIKGIKHSSLDRLIELERLALRDAHRPDFRIYTGNDLGINMIEYGSDYLLGLATFAPEKFAERDRLWESSDPAYYALSDALQHLGNVAFRPPVPAYKHSAATFLKVLGKLPSDHAHSPTPQGSAVSQPGISLSASDPPAAAAGEARLRCLPAAGLFRKSIRGLHPFRPQFRISALPTAVFRCSNFHSAAVSARREDKCR